MFYFYILPQRNVANSSNCHTVIDLYMPFQVKRQLGKKSLVNELLLFTDCSCAKNFFPGLDWFNFLIYYSASISRHEKALSVFTIIRVYCIEWILNSLLLMDHYFMNIGEAKLSSGIQTCILCLNLKKN